MKRSLLFCLFYSFFITAASEATEYKITQLTNSHTYKGGLRINNGQAVWTKYTNANDGQIFLYNGANIIQLTNTNYNNGWPDIDNGQVVWLGATHYDDFTGSPIYEIFFYDGTNIIQLTDNSPISCGPPKISNGQVVWNVWSDYDSDTDEIFLYDGTRTTRLTYNNYDDWGPSIDNGLISWTRYDGDDKEIFFYDGSNIIQLTNDNDYYDDGGPLVSNGHILWLRRSQMEPQYRYQVFLYDGLRTIQISGANDARGLYQFHNGQAVWEGYVGDIQTIFLYDGTKTIQLSRGWNPNINNGQAVWEDWIGRDWQHEQIFLYDGIRKIQLTNNAYHNSNPQISNRQILWGTWDGAYNQIFLATPIDGCTLDILNGADFTAGEEVYNNPEKLLTDTALMLGVTADGAARLLLRLKVDEANLVEFSIVGTGNPKEDGVLSSIDGTQKGLAIAVDTVPTSAGNVAFAVYQAPKTFVRQDYPNDRLASERSLSIKVQSLNSPIFEFQRVIKVVRPPVVLLHGLWSNSTMWSELAEGLKSQISDIRIYAIDYRATNAAHLANNEGLLPQEIKNIKEKFRQDGLAMARADVFGHSMGGVLARVYSGTFGLYKRPDNFYMGDINKLVTIDSPHWGSFLASIGVEGMNIPVVGRILSEIALDYEMPLDMGALDDLMLGSPRINLLERTPTDTPSHAIIGNYIVIGQNLANIENTMLMILYRVLAAAGIDPRYYIIEDMSDLVVSVASQTASMPAGATSTYPHDHLGAACTDVLNKVIELLNTVPQEPLFNTGFPVTLE